MQGPQPRDSDQVASLEHLLALLTAVYLTHWNSHWKASGVTYYGDHLLFQRLYEAVQAEIDGLAEKLLSGIAGEDFSHSAMVSLAASYVSEWERDFQNTVERSGHAEEVLQSQLHSDFSQLEEGENLPLGLNDFLAAAANTHDTHVYLLHRRLLEQSYFGDSR